MECECGCGGEDEVIEGWAWRLHIILGCWREKLMRSLGCIDIDASELMHRGKNIPNLE